MNKFLALSMLLLVSHSASAEVPSGSSKPIGLIPKNQEPIVFEYKPTSLEPIVFEYKPINQEVIVFEYIPTNQEPIIFEYHPVKSMTGAVLEVRSHMSGAIEDVNMRLVRRGLDGKRYEINFHPSSIAELRTNK